MAAVVLPMCSKCCWNSRRYLTQRADLICSPTVSVLRATRHACSSSPAARYASASTIAAKKSLRRTRHVDGLDAAACIPSGIRGAAEVAQAVTELGGKLGLIEVPNPGRVGLRVAPLQFLAASARARSHAFASPSRARARASMV